MNEGLVKLIDTIERYFPQIPEANHNEAYQIDFLRRAVIGKEWARPAVAEINETIKPFPQFSHKLSVHLQNYVDERELGNAEFDDSFLTRSGTNEMFWQAFYGKSLVNKKREMFKKAKHSKCWNCDSDSHRLRDCKRERDHKNIAANMVSFYNKNKGRYSTDKRGYQRVLLTFAEEMTSSFRKQMLLTRKNRKSACAFYLVTVPPTLKTKLLKLTKATAMWTP